MEENSKEQVQEVVTETTNNEVVNEVKEVVTETTKNEVKEPTEKPTEKPTRRRTRKQEKATTDEVEVEVEPVNEIDTLKAQLEALQKEKEQLEVERTALNDTVAKLQEEVKITPQKLGKAIKDMGVMPLSVTRENNQVMTLEAYNAMSDTQRRDWQRKNRSEYLQMMHTVKLNGK